MQEFWGVPIEFKRDERVIVRNAEVECVIRDIQINSVTRDIFYLIACERGSVFVYEDENSGSYNHSEFWVRSDYLRKIKKKESFFESLIVWFETINEQMISDFREQVKLNAYINRCR